MADKAHDDEPVARSRRAAEDAAPRDECAEGGRFMVDGRMVDANGEPIKGKKDD